MGPIGPIFPGIKGILGRPRGMDGQETEQGDPKPRRIPSASQ